MKKRNLFLSLISSVLVAVAIVTVTVVSVVKPKKNQNGTVPGASNINIDSGMDFSDYELENENRNGSQKLPYIIYSADSYEDMLTKHGTEGCYFEVVRDIDFTGVDYETLFNGSRALKANINGNGHSLNNIEIHVTLENIENFTVGRRYATVAMFGYIEDSLIENIEINNLKVTVDSDVYGYVTVSGNEYNEVVVAGVAGIAKNSTFNKVTLNSNVTGFSCISGNDKDAENAMGGFVAVAEEVVVSNSNINSVVNVNAGSNFNIGGIAGYGRVAIVENTDIDFELNLSNENVINAGGVFSYTRNLKASNLNVNVTVNTIDSQEDRNAFVENLTKDENGLLDASEVSFVSGIVNFIRANDNTQKSTFDNIKVTSNVNADIVYAGAFLDTWTENKDIANNLGLIKINDVVVDVNVDVIALHGFSRSLAVATITYSDEAKAQEGYYNIKLAGSIKFDAYFVTTSSGKVLYRPGISIYTGVKNNNDVKLNINDFYIEVSSSIFNAINSQKTFNMDKIRVDVYNSGIIPENSFKSFKVVD